MLFINWILLPERSAWGGEREADVECGSVLTEQQDPRPHEVVQRHPQRHLLPAQDPLKPDRNLLHQKLVSFYANWLSMQ